MADPIHISTGENDRVMIEREDGHVYLSRQHKYDKGWEYEPESGLCLTPVHAAAIRDALIELLADVGTPLEET